MSEFIVPSVPLREFSLWEKIRGKRFPGTSVLELTARCNNSCRHCYISVSKDNREAEQKELSFEEVKAVADEAISLGAFWCLLTGGEPLLREDFPEIYLYLKKGGLLVSVFTNATLITEHHVRIFKTYPPRDIEISVYGVTEETYERITQRPGSFAAFMRGLNLLLESGIRVRLKAMALRSNLKELSEIARFCRERTKDYFRFDPLLHLRFDGDSRKNRVIKSERLSPAEIVAIEKSDLERFQVLQKECQKLISPEFSHAACNHLFHCGAGNSGFNIGYDGFFRLCSSLHHPDCTYDLRKGNLTDAWHNFVPIVRDMRSQREVFLRKCRVCPLINLCMWCPAHAYLETGELDAPVDYFCEVAHARAQMLQISHEVK